jgi:REP element-mobilizing transposase RayT
LAYGEILREMKADFPNMDWRGLRNKHSQWKNGHFHSADNHVVSEDFDAEIERQFPAP